ncbi:AAA family ATPase [Streptomyces niveus]|uniref:AAA family ATPase n=1 Tax=Streptomyces niveus TaxID=193462 RepID=UPI0036AC39A5
MRRLTHDSAAAATGHGHGHVACVLGPAGTGKTRLLLELRSRLENSEAGAGSGLEVVTSQCVPGEGVSPYWLWTQILRRLSAGRPDAFRAAAAPFGALLAPPLPEQAAGHAPAELSEVLWPQTRFRTHDAVCEVLFTLAAQRPLVLLVEDLHWADMASLDLLRLLCSRSHSSSLSIVLSVRDQGPAGGSVVCPQDRDAHPGWPFRGRCGGPGRDAGGTDAIRSFRRRARSTQPPLARQEGRPRTRRGSTASLPGEGSPWSRTASGPCPQRYPQVGGLTAQRQQPREGLRLQTAEHGRGGSAGSRRGARGDAAGRRPRWIRGIAGLANRWSRSMLPRSGVPVGSVRPAAGTDKAAGLTGGVVPRLVVVLRSRGGLRALCNPLHRQELQRRCGGRGRNTDDSSSSGSIAGRWIRHLKTQPGSVEFTLDVITDHIDLTGTAKSEDPVAAATLLPLRYPGRRMGFERTAVVGPGRREADG